MITLDKQKEAHCVVVCKASDFPVKMSVFAAADSLINVEFMK